MSSVDGIDVSYAQGVVDWPRVADTTGLRFVMARMSHGGHGNDDLRTDKDAAANRDGMRRDFVGRTRGFYHFLGTSDPGVQAAYFKGIVGDLQDGEFVMLDVEPDKAAGVGVQSVDHIVATLEAIESEFGVVPGVYIGTYYDGADDERLRRFPLLLPVYDSEAEFRSLESRLGRTAAVWQWGKSGIDGIAGEVDSNAITDEAAFASMIKGSARQRPTQPDPDTGAGKGEGGREYVVRSGDSWFRIARQQLGSERRGAELAAFNGKTLDDIIHPDQVIMLPGPTPGPESGSGDGGREYVVRSGDSWFRIARQQLGSERRGAELAAFNGKTLDDMIHPDQVIMLPGPTLVAAVDAEPSAGSVGEKADGATASEGAEAAGAGDVPEQPTLNVPPPAPPDGAPWTSGEFLVPAQAPMGGSIFSQTFMATPAVAIVGDTLWSVGDWCENEGLWVLYQTTVDLVHNDHGGTSTPTSIRIEAGDLADPTRSNWQTTQVLVDGQSISNYWTQCGLAAVGSTLHLVWNDASSVFAARNDTGGDDNTKWSNQVTLLKHDGTPLRAGTTTALNAVGFGTSRVIIGCSSTMAADGSKAGGYVGSFDIDDPDLGDSRTWQAKSGVTLVDGLGITMDWYNVASDPEADAKPDDLPPTQLWVNVVGEARTGVTVTTGYSISLDDNGDLGPSGSRFADIEQTEPTPQTNPHLIGDGTIVRDLGGRLACYQSLTGGQIGVAITNTAGTLPAPGGVSKALGITDPLPVIGTPEQRPAAHASNVYPPRQPGVAYYADHTNGVHHTAKGRNPGDVVHYDEIKVYEIMFYSTGGNFIGAGGSGLYCQVTSAGTMQTFPSIPASRAVPHKHEKRTFRITGIIDGPIPVPAVNLTGAKGGEVSTLTYAETTTDEQQHSVSNSWSLGVKSDGKVKILGAGFAWNASFSGGKNWTDQSMVETSTVKSKQHPTVIAEDGDLVPTGRVFASETTFVWTTYRYFDAFGHPVVDGIAGDPKKSSVVQQAPLLTRLTPVVSDGDQSTFIPFSVTPGDLDSYKVDAIEQQMRKLGGPDRYVTDVLESNLAYDWSPLNSTTPERSLKYSWSYGNGFTNTKYDKLQRAYTESGWSVETSIYAGLAGGFDVAGQGYDYEVLIGGTYSHSVSDDSLHQQELSINIDKLSLPTPHAQAPKGAVKSYSFRLYFLPPPPDDRTRWVRELVEHLRHAPTGTDQLDWTSIDPGSHAWKIMFVVDDYEVAGDETESS